MKSKVWMLLLAAVLALSVALSLVLLMPREGAARAEIWSDGVLVETVDLSVDRVLTVEGKNGTNVVTISDGKIAVTDADCPDHHCMARGYCSGGAQIVCLPNRLVISFLGDQEVDAAIG